MKESKVLLAIICAALLVAATVLGTFAYLTSQDSVVNTFTVGNVRIELDETKVTPDGVPVDNANRVKENNYHLIPGKTYVKDPAVTVKAGSEESYIRIVVVIDHYKELMEIFGENFLPQNFVSGWDNELWKTTGEVKVDSINNTATYEFRYFETVTAKDEDITLDALFDTLTIPGEVTGNALKKIEGLNISIFAHAIQSANLADEEAAWVAFAKQDID